jgi:hypothetical protein
MPDETKISKKGCSHNISFLYPILKTLNYCILCSSFISDKINIIKTIKPFDLDKTQEVYPFLFWLIKELETPLKYCLDIKNEYKNTRPCIIQNMKNICSIFYLSIKTFFLSVEYFDIICSKALIDNVNTLKRVSLLCIILASKFLEDKQKAYEVQSTYKKNYQNNYSLDEIYILKLLDYKLNIFTTYDIIVDILNCGFILDGEKYDQKKLKFISKNLITILFTLTESNSYVNMTPKKIAISLIGFARDYLDLTPFVDGIKSLYMIDERNEQDYVKGMNSIKKKVKIEIKENSKNTKTNI